MELEVEPLLLLGEEGGIRLIEGVDEYSNSRLL